MRLRPRQRGAQNKRKKRRKAQKLWVLSLRLLPHPRWTESSAGSGAESCDVLLALAIEK